ncbi:hypothetical protein VDGL01_05946 [Verticillium dahliae]
MTGFHRHGERRVLGSWEASAMPPVVSPTLGARPPVLSIVSRTSLAGRHAALGHASLQVTYMSAIRAVPCLAWDGIRGPFWGGARKLAAAPLRPLSTALTRMLQAGKKQDHGS